MKKHLLNATILAVAVTTLVSIGAVSIPSVLLFPIGLMVWGVFKNVLKKVIQKIKEVL